MSPAYAAPSLFLLRTTDMRVRTSVCLRDEKLGSVRPVRTHLHNTTATREEPKQGTGIDAPGRIKVARGTGAMRLTSAISGRINPPLANAG